MRLQSVRLRGFRRFADASINLDGRVIAVTGPNEAGKSSVLEALRLLNDDETIPPSALLRDRAKAGEAIIANFRLSDEERRQVGASIKSGQCTWLRVTKSAAGPRTYTLDPPPTRDVSPRTDVAKVVAVAAKEEAFAELPESLRSLLKELRADLRSKDQELSGDGTQRLERGISELTSFAGGRQGSDAAKATARSLSGRLREAQEWESEDWRDERARSLRTSVPQFLLFGDGDRTLRSSYELARQGQADPSRAPNPALDNLLAAGGTTRSAMAGAILNAGTASSALSSLSRHVESKLDMRLKSHWGQSGQIKVALEPSGTVLNINVATHGLEFFGLGDHSDGFRIYVALRAFLLRHALSSQPILLVDEAETHLHYDAQADLVQMFEQQREVSQVIYTTHSLGCLPQDIGLGVRVVIPDRDTGLSVVQNAWTTQDAGITPIVRLIGAATIPMAPARNVVIGEGPSEAILLPTLLRHANQLRGLPFQVVGGLATASDPELRRLEEDAQHVAYWLDGDDSGRRREAMLIEVGIQKEHIVPLPEGVTLEDLVNPGLLALAINHVLDGWHQTSDRMDAQDLPPKGRMAVIREWCKSRNTEEVSHAAIARAVIGLATDPSSTPALIDTRQAQILRAGYAKLLEALGVAAKDAGAFASSEAS